MNNYLVKTGIVCTVTRVSKKMIREYIAEGYLVPFKDNPPDRKLELTVADIVMMGIMRGVVPGGGDKEPLQGLAKDLNGLVRENYTRLNKLNWIIIDLCDFNWMIVDEANSYDKYPTPRSRLLKSIHIREFTERYVELNCIEPK